MQVGDGWVSSLTSNGPPDYALNRSDLIRPNWVQVPSVAILKSFPTHFSNKTVLIALTGLEEEFDGLLEGAYVYWENISSAKAEDMSDWIWAKDGRSAWKRISSASAGELVLTSLRDGQDNTALLQSVFNTIPEGTRIIVSKPGLYFLNSITISRKISWEAADGVTFKHVNNATGDMFLFRVPPSSMKGGTYDGNHQNQIPQAANWWSLVRVDPSTGNPYSFSSFKEMNFENFVFSGLRGWQMNGSMKVRDCLFHNGKEHGGILGLQSQGFHYGTSYPNTRSHVDISHCEFKNDTLPGQAGRNPGGAIISGNEPTNSYPSIKFHHNKLFQVGQNFALNSIAGIHCYEDTANIQITDNIFDECLYSPISAQNCARTIIRGNIIKNTYGTDGSQGIWVDPHQRAQVGGANEPFIVTGNQVIGRDTGEGIRVYGSVGVGRDAIVSQNYISGCIKGISVGSAGPGWQGPLLLSDNIIKNISGNGMEFVNVSDEIKIHNNHVEAGIALIATTGVNTAKFYLQNNFLKATLAGSYGLIIRGALLVHVYSGSIKNDNTGNVLNFQADALGNKIGTLLYSSQNQNEGGFTSLVYTDILKVVGPEFGIPMTKAQRNQIATPSDGLRILQTDATPGWRYYNNGAWVRLTEVNDA